MLVALTICVPASRVFFGCPVVIGNSLPLDLMWSVWCEKSGYNSEFDILALLELQREKLTNQCDDSSNANTRSNSSLFVRGRRFLCRTPLRGVAPTLGWHEILYAAHSHYRHYRTSNVCFIACTWVPAQIHAGNDDSGKSQCHGVRDGGSSR